MIRRIWILTVGCFHWLGLAAVVVAQDQQEELAQVNQAKLDPSGIWIWESATGGVLRLRLSHRDGQLTGTLARRFGDRELRPVEIEEARLDRNLISFSVNNGGLKYVGSLSDETIDGWYWGLSGARLFEGEWKAKRGLEWVDVLGEWKLTAEAPNGGTVEWILNLSKDGDNVNGTVTSERLGEIDVFDIEVKDGQLTFAVVREANGNEVRADFLLERRGDALKGTMRPGDNADQAPEVSGERIAESSGEH